MTAMDIHTASEAAVHKLVAQIISITIKWAKHHDIWYDACHTDPVAYYDDEPWPGGALLLLCAESPINTVLEWDHEEAQELGRALESVGVYLECHESCIWGYHLIDDENDLAQAAYRVARWKWICRLVEADTADVSGDLYAHFAANAQDFHRLAPREFETLISSIFAARGWKTELGPGSGDEGVDLRIWQRDPIGDLLTLVQVKRYAPGNPIKLDAVAALSAHVDRHKASRGLFITSSRYLPGVHRFAEQAGSRLILADTSNLAQWCHESAQEMIMARNRILAAQELLPLLQEIQIRGVDPRLVVGDRRYPSFCIVLRESRSSALLAHIPSVRISGDIQMGQVMPVFNQGAEVAEYRETVFRATRTEERGEVQYWGQRTLFSSWNGRPVGFDHWD